MHTMPYRKHYKRNGRRPGYKACGKMVWNDAAKALRLAKQVKAMVNVEYKHHTTKGTATTIEPTPSIYNLSTVQQGDTDNHRDGSKIRCKWYTFNYTITMNNSATSTQIRVMIVLDRQTNQSTFPSAHLLADDSVSDNIVSGLNLDNAGRFRLLYDRVHTLNIDGNRSITRKVYKKIDIPIHFDASTGSIADLTRSSLHLLFMSNEPSNKPNITFNYRLRYIDN